MLCQKCNAKKATVHYTKIINGEKSEIHLCEDCARENEEINFEVPFTINNFLTGMLDSINTSPFKMDYIQSMTCEKCGMNYNRFKQLGRLGCKECYKTFGDKLIPLVKRIHGSDTHSGKIPRKEGALLRRKRELQNLKRELNRAVLKEEYEKAAELRDKIKKLEQELGEGI